MNYVLAKSTQLPLKTIGQDICRHARDQELAELTPYAELHFAAQMRVVDRKWPIQSKL